jgi:hypothetical protein
VLTKPKARSVKKTKIALFLLVLILPILTSIIIVQKTSLYAWDDSQSNRNKECVDVEFSSNQDEKGCIYSEAGLYAISNTGWPIEYGQLMDSDYSKASYNLLLLVNGLIIISMFYIPVGASVVIRRRFFNQAPDGSPLKKKG